MMNAMPVSFFPPSSFEHDPSVNDLIAELHTDLLVAFDEPALSSGNFVAGKIFRFVRFNGWIGSVSIIPNGGTANLAAKELDYSGSHPPPHGAYKKSSRDLTDAEWQRFRKLFDRTDFWNLPSANDQIGLDGCRWTCEACEPGAYHFVHQWSPDGSAFATLCNYVMRLKDAKPKRKRG
jgi:hypothetical protein